MALGTPNLTQSSSLHAAVSRPAPSSARVTTYWDYIKVEPLLALQTGLASDERSLSNEEVMFIVVHQVDELWFKLILRELVSVRDILAEAKSENRSSPRVVRSIRRAALLLEQVSRQFELMETLATRDYLGFRDKLSPASGYQSAQLREIELLVGLSDADRIPLGTGHSYVDALRSPDGTEGPAYRRVEARRHDGPTVLDVVTDWLFRTPIEGSMPGKRNDAKVVVDFVESYLTAYERHARAALEAAKGRMPSEADAQRLEARIAGEIRGARAFLHAADATAGEQARARRVRAAIVLIETHGDLPLLAWPREVLDSLVAFEQAFVLCRHRHARMVERIIGKRAGTGGSTGVDYLDQTALKYRVFRDIAAARTVLLREGAAPPLNNPAFYDFAHRS